MSFEIVGVRPSNSWSMIRRVFGFVTSDYRRADFDVGLRQVMIVRRPWPPTNFRYCYSVGIQ